MILTKGYKIEHTQNTDRFTLYIKGPSHLTDEIYKSIENTNILSNALYDDDLEAIIFTAETVETLTTYVKKKCLNMTQSIKMIHDLSKQIAHLETNGFAFYGYDLEDIVVINETTFIIVNSKYLLDIEEDNIFFISPIIPPYFSSPEVNELTKLPSKINYRSNYYSLGALILFCLLKVYIYSEIDLKSDSELESKLESKIDQILQPIYYTKMYWFLKKCFLQKSERRILLFI
jgi:serine/threonine protein kinase